MPPLDSEQVDVELGARLVRLGTATLGESGAIALRPGLRPMWEGASLAGPAFTVECAPGDNLGIHAAVARVPAGSVLAVSGLGEVQRGYWGEVLTVAAMSAGAVGLVIDGTVRDVDAIKRRQFPVFARGTALVGASKNGPGATGNQVTLAGGVVRPGDWLVADTDGVVVIAQEKLEACCEAGEKRAAKESMMFKRLKEGITTVELLGLDSSAIELGAGSNREV